MTRILSGPAVAVAAAVLFFLSFPGAAALAGNGDAGVPPDSSRSRTLLDRLQFHPSYTSTYTLNRTSRLWDQGLRFSRPLGPLSLNNSWTLKTKQDEAASNLRSKNGAMSVKVDYDLGDRQLVTMGVQGDFRRNSQLSTLRDQVDNNTDLSLATSTKAPEQLLHRMIPALRDFSLATDANFGLARQRSLSRRAISRDSTSVNGSVQHYLVSFGGNIAGIAVDTEIDADRRSGDSATRQRNPETGRLVREVKDNTRNNTTTMGLRLSWKPLPGLSTNATANYIDAVNDYWDIQANASQGGQETKDGLDVKTNFGLEWKPNPDIQVRSSYYKSISDADFALQERDFRKETDESTLEGLVKLPATAGPLSGAEVSGKYSFKQDDNELQESSDYLQKNRSLRASARKQIGNKLQFTFNEDISFLQSFYRDKLLDRDERRILTEGVLAYTPSMVLNGYFSVNFSNRKTVNIPASSAINNQTVDSYKVTGEVKYTQGRSQAGQRYTIQADYTVYDFAENRNTITRTNGVQTSFTHRLSGSILLGVAHEYQRRESGNYTRTAPKLPRTYRASQSEIRQMLTLTSTYRLGEHLRIEGRQMFDQRATAPMGVENPRVSKNLRGEFSFKVDFDHEFRREFKIGATFQKTESTSEKNYWNVRMNVERLF